MLKRLLLFLNLSFSIFCIELNIKPEQYEKMNILINLIKPDEYLISTANKLKSDLEFGGQFNINIGQSEQITKKSDITKLESQGFPIIIFLNNIKDEKDGIQWRLYDSALASMIGGKKIFSNQKDHVAHYLADQIWPELTSAQSSFCSVIAACKKKYLNKKKSHSNIYVFHPIELFGNFSKPKLVINEQTTCLSPRWNNHKPLLYYSKHTPYNVRLMSVDLNKKKGIVANFDGLNLTPAFSDNKKIVLSLTIDGKGSLCQYNFDEKTNKGIYVPLTNKSIHAVSPSFIDEDNVLFCSINKSNKMRISILNLKNNEIEYLSKPTEYCTSPAYCKKNNKIAYCKKINGILQIFTLDLDSKEDKQLTSCKGDKDSCSWSPCGNYIVFCVDNNVSSRIAIFNLQNDEIKFLTPINEHWSNPCWSPIYDELAFL